MFFLAETTQDVSRHRRMFMSFLLMAALLCVVMMVGQEGPAWERVAEGGMTSLPRKESLSLPAKQGAKPRHATLASQLEQQRASEGYATSSGYSPSSTQGNGYSTQQHGAAAAGYSQSSSVVPQYYRQLANKEGAYNRAIAATVRAKASFDVAKKDAVTTKLELETFKKQQALHRAEDVHKAAAYVEVKRAASEERSSKATQRAAEISTKLSKKKKAEAAAQIVRAAQLAQKAKADKDAALREVRAAAAIRAHKNPSAASHATSEGQALSKASAALRAFKSKTEASAKGEVENVRQQVALFRKVKRTKIKAKNAADDAIGAVKAAKRALVLAHQAVGSSSKKRAHEKAIKSQHHAQSVVERSESDAKRAAHEFGVLVRQIEATNRVGMKTAVAAAQSAMKASGTGQSIATKVVENLFKKEIPTQRSNH